MKTYLPLKKCLNGKHPDKNNQHLESKTVRRICELPHPEEIHRNAVKHGWYEGVSEDDVYFLPAQLALIHSEISEALEAYRVRDMKSVSKELGNIVLRVMDLSCFIGADFQQIIWETHKENLQRPYKHGGKII